MLFTFTLVKKTCSCCGKEKTLSEFYTQAYVGTPTDQCKTCINVKRSVQRHKAKHGKFVSKEKVRHMEDIDYKLVDWRDTMVHFGGACAFCGKLEGRSKKEKMDRDHLIAVSKGGKTVRENIIPACTKCNRGRGNKDWLNWFQAQPFFDEAKVKIIQAWKDQVK